MSDCSSADGYVKRGPGPDDRTISVSLTAAGRRAATKVSAARAAVTGAGDALTERR